MPDTGAPWNIPYVAGTDLVADWPTDSQSLATAIADGLDEAYQVKQVVSAVKTDTFTTTSTSYTPITGMTVTITPTSNTSRVMVIAQISIANSGTGNGTHVQLVRDSTAIHIGDASSNRVRSTVSTSNQDRAAGQFSGSIAFVDSPATTSATTYSLEMRVGTGGTGTFNRSQTNTDDANHGLPAASLIAIEVAA